MAREAIHPGEHIAIELDELDEVDGLGLSASGLARTLNIARSRLTEIIRGRGGISADTALRLAQWLGTTPEYWMNLQRNYELRWAREQAGDEIRQTIKPRDSAV